jgi:methyl-accepting chemotaxis protein
MLVELRHHLATLKGRLAIGAAVLLGLMGAATWIGYATVETLTEITTERFAALREGTSIGTSLQDLITTEIHIGRGYLDTGDPALEARFVAIGGQADELRRRYKDLPGLTLEENQQILEIGRLHSEVEVRYALAHAVYDLGRPEEARAMADSAETTIQRLETTIRRISAEQADKLSTASADLQRTGSNRQDLLLVVLTLALGLGTWIIYAALRGINQPLSRLIGAAEQLGQGDLRVQIDGKMLQEFDALGSAFNSMAGQLRTLVLETVSIAEQIQASAFDLSGISEEVAASSGEVATAMVEITRGAEGQSGGLQTTTHALDEMGRRTHGIQSASREVSQLSAQIHDVASHSQARVLEAISTLLEIRGVVQISSSEVRELDRASSQIDRFVETISAIARQTNLLALNAAIEAARAGEHGRGFAVVAEEVRKLADGSARAAQEVAQVVQEIHARVSGLVTIMDRGSRQVTGVEAVSQSASEALERIVGAIGDVRLAAERVASAVTSNQEALEQVEDGLSQVSGTAESHAASAQQVAAAAEEQSAATEEMSSASSQLLDAADRMKELVSGLKV